MKSDMDTGSMTTYKWSNLGSIDCKHKKFKTGPGYLLLDRKLQLFCKSAYQNFKALEKQNTEK